MYLIYINFKCEILHYFKKIYQFGPLLVRFWFLFKIFNLIQINYTQKNQNRSKYYFLIFY
jgi:hypothetical protein